VKVGVLYRWRFFRRCGLCWRIGFRAFERVEWRTPEGANMHYFTCMDRAACATRRARRR